MEMLAAAILFAVVLGSGDSLQGEAGPVLRSACEVDYPPFCFVDESGRATGFSVELLEEAADAMGRDVTFRTGVWSEVRGMLEEGGVEVLPLVGRTPEREELFDFTFPYLSLHGAIVVRRGVSGIEDLGDLRGLRVEVMEGDNAEEFLRREERGIDIVTTGTFEEALLDLSEGRCDAVVVQRLVALRLIREAGLQNLRVIDRPLEGFRQDFCFAVREGDGETLALLNEGLSIVMADGTLDRLRARWFGSLELPSGHTIVVGGDRNYPPYEFIDEDGNPAGYNVELTRAVAAAAGLEVEIRLGDWAEIRSGLRNGGIDVAQGMFYSPQRDLELDFTQPHTVVHHVAVVREDFEVPGSVADLTGLSLVVMEGDIAHDFMLEKGFEGQFAALATQEDALGEVAAGRSDCAIVARLPAAYWIERNGWGSLKVADTPLFSAEYCFAVPHGRQALLAHLSEGLKMVEESGEYRDIYTRWMGVYEDRPPGLAAALRTAAWVLVPLVLVLIGAFAWTRTLRRKVRQRTAELRESERRYRLLAENTLDVIWTMTPDLVFTYVNPAIERMTGYTPDEWVGSSLADHCDDENLALMRKAVEAEIRKGPEHEGVIFEAEMLHRDGTPVVVEIHGRVIFDEDWRPVMLQGTTRDVTERRRMEGERTRLQQQLLQAQRLESVGRLAGGVAHDFNNMLQSILGNAEMALDRCGVEGELPEHLREIEGAAGHAARLTGQLLAFARRQSSRPEVLNLNESVADTLDMLRRLMGEDIDLLWKPEEDLWRVRIDPSQVDQILANLCVNARDAIQGNGKVTIETANASFDEDYCRRNPEFDPGDYVMLAVSDDGIGMDTDVMASIFEPFFTTKEKEKGTGLGLATVYGIVKQNEGFINVYSEPGEGSTFKVYLSRHAGGKAPSVKRGAGDRGITDSEGETILLVEDEPAILKVARSILEGLGYEVLTASTPEEALELAENLSTGIDLLVTDVVLPGMNGRDLAAKLREQDEGLRVLYMSGYTANVIMHQGILENGVHFVQKPFSMERLALSVRKALGGPTPS